MSRLPEAAETGAPTLAPGVRLATLTLIRWGAIAGQAVALLVVHFGLGFPVPLAETLAVVAGAGLLNLGVSLGRPAHRRLSEAAAASLLAFDVVQLSVLLYLTGGLDNPFAFLLLAPLTVSATILSLRSTAALCGIALVAISGLAYWHMPLPWSGGRFELPPVYVLGSWIALAFGIGFFAWYTWRVAEEARRMSNALAASQLALAREQQLSALGGLAAAAAHELGSPLGTIAVVTRELARDVPEDSPLAGDVQLLLSETARCRDILAELGPRSAEADAGPFATMPVDVVVESAACRHAAEGVRLRFDPAPEAGAAGLPAPLVRNSPEIVHGLGNIVQNAVQFAHTEVRVITRWSEREIRVIVEDDGPGIPTRLLERLGEPYVSTREAGGGHMGLGIFIAQTLLQRTGARLVFENRWASGARVSVVWDRAALALAPGAPADDGEGQR